MSMCWLLKFENTFKQVVKLASWNYFFESKAFYSFNFRLRLSYLG